ncbi:MAG: DUF721 domain-containing protein [Candidatus Omnitrophica bacterium]|nr:DUF721 domain-containing protein [Candidatus Omnitrophota bacterium]
MKDAKHVGGILDGLIRKWEQGTVKKGNAVMEAFSKAAEEETKKHAKPVSLKKGVLVVIVENSSWLYELTLKKREFLKKFNESYTGKIKAKDVRFRIGSFY